MKYRIKTTNTETGKSMIMDFPTFTNKRKAEEWVKEFDKAMKGLAKSEVVKEEHGRIQHMA